MGVAARVLTEFPPSLRWRIGKLLTVLLYRRAFAAIGSGSVIVRPLVLRGVERISLGARCAIYEGAWLATESGGTLTVGDDVYLGHSVHLHALDDVTVGAGCVIADGVYVGSSVYQQSDLATIRGGGPIAIGRGCFIGHRAIILGGVTIGDGAVIGAGSVVTRDVPAGATAAGVPARMLSKNAPQPESQAGSTG